jgi:hypothetical protein
MIIMLAAQQATTNCLTNQETFLHHHQPTICIQHHLSLTITDELPALEFTSDDRPDIWFVQDLSDEKLFEFPQLPIVRVFEPTFNGYTIIDLVTKRVWRIIDQQGCFQRSPQHVQVLEKVPLDL